MGGVVDVVCGDSPLIGAAVVAGVLESGRVALAVCAATRFEFSHKVRLDSWDVVPRPQGNAPLSTISLDLGAHFGAYRFHGHLGARPIARVRWET